jgi:hypothetical protein
MADIKLDQIRPLSSPATPERSQAPAKTPRADFGKALEQASIQEKTRVVVEKFEQDAAELDDLMKRSQHQARLMQSLMNRKPDPEA